MQDDLRKDGLTIVVRFKAEKLVVRNGAAKDIVV